MAAQSKSGVKSLAALAQGIDADEFTPPACIPLNAHVVLPAETIVLFESHFLARRIPQASHSTGF